MGELYEEQGYALNMPEQSVHAVMLCCDCGLQIEPNATAMCVDCLRKRVDITDGIPKQGVLYFCRGCARYLNPPDTWILCELESRELLTLCLKKLKGLAKVHLVDAGFVWTEPHSRRVKVKLTIQKEVFSGAILEQVFVVEYVVQYQMCLDCHKREAKDSWNAVVQLRQKVSHKKTFYFLEQLIIKHRAHADTIQIRNSPDGLDFYYSTRNHAKKFVEFLQCVVPIRFKTAERLISQDIRSNIYNYKFTFSVEIIPICKEDIVALPKQLVRACGGMATLFLVTKVGNVLHMIDPVTLYLVEINSSMFWQYPFQSICSHKQHTEYIILDAEPVFDHHGNPLANDKYTVVDFTIARVVDFGENDTQYITRSHLGNILHPGDLVWGFDVQNSNFNDDNANALDRASLPEVILIKKSYSEKRKTGKKRNWRLKHLEKEEETPMTKKEEAAAVADYEGFLQDLEEDVDYRSAINIYKDASVAQPMVEEQVDGDELDVAFEEMIDEMDELQINTEGPDAEDLEEVNEGGVDGEEYVPEEGFSNEYQYSS